MTTLTQEQLEQKNQMLASAVELSEDELDQAAGGCAGGEINVEGREFEGGEVHGKRYPKLTLR